MIIGDDAACSDALLALINAKLQPLKPVAVMTDCERVRNVAQLCSGLLRLVASAVPSAAQGSFVFSVF